MAENRGLFKLVLDEFAAAGILPRLVLIGNWCLALYREYFEKSPEIPLLRTLDIDFWVPYPPEATGSADIAGILEKHGFDEVYSVLGGFSKFVRPELEIEFVTPELGKAKSAPYRFDDLNIAAQGLRYVWLAQKFDLTIDYQGNPVRVPEPAAFVLLKLLASTKRREPAKRDRDVSIAIQIAEFILSFPEQREKLRSIFGQIPRSWQQKVLKIAFRESKPLYEELAH